MPRYEYLCEDKHVTEKYGGYDDSIVICDTCGELAMRRPIYRDQYIHAETGPKGGRKNEVPHDEKSYRHQFKEFQEASQEVDYAYSRVDDPAVQAPNYYKEGLKKARKVDARVKAV